MGGAPLADLEAACAALAKDCPCLYQWAPRAGLRTAEHLEAMARAVVKVEGGRPLLLVVDYLQRMAEGEDLRRGVRDVSLLLRDLSRPGGLDSGWPGAAVLALSSTARDNYKHFATCSALKEAWKGGKRKGKDRSYDVPPVSLEGLGKESGEIETDAALLLVMTTNAGQGPGSAPRDGLVIVPKNRSGDGGAVEFTFYPACGRFVEGKPEKSGGGGGRGGRAKRETLPKISR